MVSSRWPNPFWSVAEKNCGLPPKLDALAAAICFRHSVLGPSLLSATTKSCTPTPLAPQLGSLVSRHAARDRSLKIAPTGRISISHQQDKTRKPPPLRSLPRQTAHCIDSMPRVWVNHPPRSDNPHHLTRTSESQSCSTGWARPRRKPGPRNKPRRCCSRSPRGTVQERT